MTNNQVVYNLFLSHCNPEMETELQGMKTWGKINDLDFYCSRRKSRAASSSSEDGELRARIGDRHPGCGGIHKENGRSRKVGRTAWKRQMQCPQNRYSQPGIKG